MSAVDVRFWDDDLDEEIDVTLCSIGCAISWLSAWTDDDQQAEREAASDD